MSAIAKDNIMYYEIEFGRKGECSYFMVVKATRQPTIEEANIFCKYSAEMYGMPVIGVDPISEEEARSSYDFSNEANWPIFGLKGES